MLNKLHNNNLKKTYEQISARNDNLGVRKKSKKMNRLNPFTRQMAEKHHDKYLELLETEEINEEKKPEKN